MHKISNPVIRTDAASKASGKAEYTADLDFEGLTWGIPVASSIQCGTIESIRYPELPEGYFITGADDIDGLNRASIVAQDWPVFAEKEISFYGQTICVVSGPDQNICRALAANIKIDYFQTDAVSGIGESAEWFNDYHIKKGDPEKSFSSAWKIFVNEFRTGIQEQAYMEPQAMTAVYNNGSLTIYGSLQCPYYVKNSIAASFKLDPEKIRIIQSVTGGAFGGKEDYPSILASQAAAAAIKSGSPVRIVLDRRYDMTVTPKRHPSVIRIRTAVDKEGRITALDIDTKIDAGAFQTLSGVVLERAVFICSGAYNIENLKVRGRTMKTNHVPSGAFRGFGGPQALFAAEMNMYAVAKALKQDPSGFKLNHLLKKGDLSVTGGRFREDILLKQMFEKVNKVSGYTEKYERYSKPENLQSRKIRGIGISYAAHGGAFTGSGEQEIIKSLVRLKASPADSDPDKPVITVLVSNVEMGQGASTTLRKIVAETMNIPLCNIVFQQPDTAEVPDSGPTVASRTVMIVGKLLADAAAELSLKLKDSVSNYSDAITVEKRYVHPPGLVWDEKTFSGDAYPGYSWSVNVVEVEVDSLTRQIEVKGSWAVYDVGTPIDLTILKGQMQGGTVQAFGYSTIENMTLRNGKFAQASFTDYTIPTTMDFPDTECQFMDNPYPRGPFGAKAAGELPNEGPAAAVAAAVSQATGKIQYSIPITPEMLEEQS